MAVRPSSAMPRSKRKRWPNNIVACDLFIDLCSPHIPQAFQKSCRVFTLHYSEDAAYSVPGYRILAVKIFEILSRVLGTVMKHEEANSGLTVIGYLLAAVLKNAHRFAEDSDQLKSLLDYFEQMKVMCPMLGNLPDMPQAPELATLRADDAIPPAALHLPPTLMTPTPKTAPVALPDETEDIPRPEETEPEPVPLPAAPVTPRKSDRLRLLVSRSNKKKGVNTRPEIPVLDDAPVEEKPSIARLKSPSKTPTKSTVRTPPNPRRIQLRRRSPPSPSKTLSFPAPISPERNAWLEAQVGNAINVLRAKGVVEDEEDPVAAKHEEDQIAAMEELIDFEGGGDADGVPDSPLFTDPGDQEFPMGFNDEDFDFGPEDDEQPIAGPSNPLIQSHGMLSPPASAPSTPPLQTTLEELIAQIVAIRLGGHKDESDVEMDDMDDVVARITKANLTDLQEGVERWRKDKGLDAEPSTLSPELSPVPEDTSTISVTKDREGETSSGWDAPAEGTWGAPAEGWSAPTAGSWAQPEDTAMASPERPERTDKGKQREAASSYAPPSTRTSPLPPPVEASQRARGELLPASTLQVARPSLPSSSPIEPINKPAATDVDVKGTTYKTTISWTCTETIAAPAMAHSITFTLPSPLPSPLPNDYCIVTMKQKVVDPRCDHDGLWEHVYLVINAGGVHGSLAFPGREKRHTPISEPVSRPIDQYLVGGVNKIDMYRPDDWGGLLGLTVDVKIRHQRPGARLEESLELTKNVPEDIAVRGIEEAAEK